MYYEEKLIKGVLCWRGDPDGEWKPVTVESLSARVVGAEARVLSVAAFLAVVRERLDCLKEHEYVTPCDALAVLETNLDAAVAEAKL